MEKRITIYGKDSWPYTSNARRAFSSQGFSVEYVNIRGDGADRIAEMLEKSGGRRVVPVLVDGDGKVTIGYGGTWGAWRLTVRQSRLTESGSVEFPASELIRARRQKLTESESVNFPEREISWRLGER